MRNNYLSAIDLKAQINPCDFYSKEQEVMHTQSKRQWVKAGLCPFHKDKNAGSFQVNLENGAYNCFSCGAKGGDIIKFTQEKYNLDFGESMDKLKRDWRAS